MTVLLLGSFSTSADAEKATPAREALKPFNILIGKWNATGIAEGSADERQKGHWNEVLEWSWQFKGDAAWLNVTFEKGKYFTKGELRALPKVNTFQLKLDTIDKQTVTFEGAYKDKYLTVDRTDEKTKAVERLYFALLHGNRITYSYEVKAPGKTFFTRAYRVGATKDGEPFVAVAFNDKECVVSGGVGTSTVTFKGKTYYVCCSGCRDAFNDEPEKYAAAFELKRANFKK
ncbi:MAG: YHS domain-containing protein [Planctomycetes bacterium]|nr:YHS domain-containing protein [Planctomycetota bacterium]